MPPSLTPNDCTCILFPHRVLFYFLWFSEQIAIISLCIIKQLASIIPKECVYCVVRNKCLNKIHGIFHLQKLKTIQIFLERKFSMFKQNSRTTDKTKLNYSKRHWESWKSAASSPIAFHQSIYERNIRGREHTGHVSHRGGLLTCVTILN
jgi:hypothetical protein